MTYIRKSTVFDHFGKGPMAEWLGSALQKLLQRFESASDLIVKMKSPVVTATAGLLHFSAYTCGIEVNFRLRKDRAERRFRRQKCNILLIIPSSRTKHVQDLNSTLACLDHLASRTQRTDRPSCR